MTIPFMEVWQRGLMQWIANPPMFFKGIRWFESNHFRWQCSSVVEQEIHTLYVGSSILPTALCR